MVEIKRYHHEGLPACFRARVWSFIVRLALPITVIAMGEAVSAR